jgi:hypothetical protein
MMNNDFCHPLENGDPEVNRKILGNLLKAIFNLCRFLLDSRFRGNDKLSSFDLFKKLYNKKPRFSWFKVRFFRNLFSQRNFVIDLFNLLYI